MKKMQRFGIVALVFAMLGLTGVASAQTADSFNLDRFSAPETNQDNFGVSRPLDQGHMKFGAQLHFDYANDPLTFERESGSADSEVQAIVGDQLNGTVGLSLGFANRVVLYAGLPVTILMDGDDTSGLTAGVNPADGAGMGDVYFGLRLRLLGELDDVFALAVQVTGTAPTAGDQFYRGEESLTVHPELLAELRLGRAYITLNAGIRIRQDAAPQGVFQEKIGDELTGALGFGMPIWTGEDPRNHLDAHIQAYMSADLTDMFSRERTPLEAIAGLRYHHNSGFSIGAAGGLGLTRGYGSPDLRIIGMLGWRMAEDYEAEPVDTDGDGLIDSEDSCPTEPEDMDGDADYDGCPEENKDRDGDGIANDADQCPDEPEDKDAFEDDNGCPDTDNDADGILDVDDQCPLQPEDKDGFEDENGCPDPDNDNDGLLDASDKCPNEAGPVENKGCPDSDRDGDTVVDRLDNCPDEKGSPENFGCAKKQKVRIGAGKLEILDKVYFRTNRDKIRSRSFSLLKNVASVLKSHPEIKHVRVEGHTDSRGKHASNVKLSQRRAEAVVKYLVKAGVEAERLEAKGFGPDKPIIPNAKKKDEHAQNRRVEFNIPQSSGIEHSNNEATSDTIDR